MLVRFHSDAWSSITMFGEVAVRLLKMAGLSGTVPSALLAADIASALARLRQGLSAAGVGKESEQSLQQIAEDTATPPRVDIQLHAYPLVQMLSAAVQQKCNVMWEEEHPVV
jgi:hypothetical protein